MEERSRRVVSRFVEAGYGGWSPSDGPDDPDPSEAWEYVKKQFPKALQRLLGDPHKKSDHSGDDVTVTMTNLVELGDDSGVELTVTAAVREDADEDGKYRRPSLDTEYFLWVGRKHWDSGREGQRHLPRHLKEFAKVLEEQDPEGYKKAGF